MASLKKAVPCSKATKGQVKEQRRLGSVVQGITRIASHKDTVAWLAEPRGARRAFGKAEGQSLARVMETVLNGSYPRSFSYIYMNKASPDNHGSLVKEFCKFIFSKKVKQLSSRCYIPVPFESGPSRIGHFGYLDASAWAKSHISAGSRREREP